MHKILALTLTLLPCPLIAQGLVCEGPKPSAMPDCLVGAWHGEADIADKLRSVLPPGASGGLTISEDTGKNLFTKVFEDGFYVTGIMTGRLESDPDIVMDFKSTPTLGWMAVDGDSNLSFCALEGTSDGIFTMSVGGSSNTTTASNLPNTGFVPEVTMTCEGDDMKMLVHLPAPVGVVTYSFRRIEAGALPESVQELYDRRMED